MRSVGGVRRSGVHQSSFSRPRHKLLGGVVYFVFMRTPGDDRPVKVGHTQKPKSRLSQLQSSSPYPVELVGALQVPDGEDCAEFERLVRGHFEGNEEKTMNGEWFDIHPDRVKWYIQTLSPKLGMGVVEPEEILEKWL